MASIVLGPAAAACDSRWGGGIAAAARRGYIGPQRCGQKRWRAPPGTQPVEVGQPSQSSLLLPQRRQHGKASVEET